MGVQLPYPMQLGSGTYDYQLGLIYNNYSTDWYWGAQIIYTGRTGENDNGYTLGDEFVARGWVNRSWNDNFSTYARIDFRDVTDTDGRDVNIPMMNEMMTPVADPKLRERQDATFVVGATLSTFTAGKVRHTFDLEIGQPVYEATDGPQMSQDWWSRISWQVLF